MKKLLLLILLLFSLIVSSQQENILFSKLNSNLIDEDTTTYLKTYFSEIESFKDSKKSDYVLKIVKNSGDTILEVTLIHNGVNIYYCNPSENKLHRITKGSTNSYISIFTYDECGKKLGIIENSKHIYLPIIYIISTKNSVEVDKFRFKKIDY